MRDAQVSSCLELYYVQCHIYVCHTAARTSLFDITYFFYMLCVNRGILNILHPAASFLACIPSIMCCSF